jgi:hypothetical protein
MADVAVCKEYCVVVFINGAARDEVVRACCATIQKIKELYLKHGEKMHEIVQKSIDGELTDDDKVIYNKLNQYNDTYWDLQMFLDGRSDRDEYKKTIYEFFVTAREFEELLTERL